MGVDVEVVERCEISPPATGRLEEERAEEVGLSMMDIPWLFFPPTQPLFFYSYPHSLSHFSSSTLPLLKLSLSRSLLLSFPLSSRLLLHPHPHPRPRPPLLLSSSPAVSLTVATCTAADDDDDDDVFRRLSTHRPRDAALFRPLVPSLPPISDSSSDAPVPVFAAQVTFFPNSGLCLGLACHHVVADARTFNLFLKAWASLSLQLSSPPPHPPLRGFFGTPPYYDRTVLRDPRGLLHRLLFEWWNCRRQAPPSPVLGGVGFPDMVRSTFAVGATDMACIRRWILSQCNAGNLPHPPHLSPYVLTCAFLWVVWVKAHLSLRAHDNDPRPTHRGPVYFGFIAGGLTRLGYPVPASYFGNCVGFGRAEAVAHELVGETGIVVAANALGSTVKRLDKDLFAEAERWISDWRAFSESELHVTVAGSPKVDLYDTDFGWGRPRKIEDISIDKSRAISLHESRDVKGGIEVGISLPKPKMDAFTSLFTAGLKVMKQITLPNPNS